MSFLPDSTQQRTCQVRLEAQRNFVLILSAMHAEAKKLVAECQGQMSPPSPIPDLELDKATELRLDIARKRGSSLPLPFVCEMRVV